MGVDVIFTLEPRVETGEATEDKVGLKGRGRAVPTKPTASEPGLEALKVDEAEINVFVLELEARLGPIEVSGDTWGDRTDCNADVAGTTAIKDSELSLGGREAVRGLTAGTITNNVGGAYADPINVTATLGCGSGGGGNTG